MSDAYRIEGMSGIYFLSPISAGELERHGVRMAKVFKGPDPKPDGGKKKPKR